MQMTRSLLKARCATSSSLLGSEFKPIQNNYRSGCLPSEWQTTHWPSLLVLCQDFYHSVNPKVFHQLVQESQNVVFFPFKVLQRN